MINELDLRSLWKELDDYEKEIGEESKTLQDIWVKIAGLKTKNEADMKKLLEQPELKFLAPETIVSFNVGGQIFESQVSILTRDPFSVLAACCRETCPFERDSEGNFYFERDWWLFRHIISYLRSNVLPNEIETLKELYMEASFYRLDCLQRSIEELPVNHVTNFFRSHTADQYR